MFPEPQRARAYHDCQPPLLPRVLTTSYRTLVANTSRPRVATNCAEHLSRGSKTQLSRGSKTQFLRTSIARLVTLQHRTLVTVRRRRPSSFEVIAWLDATSTRNATVPQRSGIGARAEKMAPPLLPSRGAIEAGANAARLATPLSDPCRYAGAARNADPRCNARDAAKPA